MRIKSNRIKTCQPAWATVLTPEGIKTLGEVGVGDQIWSGSQFTKIRRKIDTGKKEVFEYRTPAGAFYGTADHRVFENGTRVMVKDAKSIDTAIPRASNIYAGTYIETGPYIGAGEVTKLRDTLSWLFSDYARVEKGAITLRQGDISADDDLISLQQKLSSLLILSEIKDHVLIIDRPDTLKMFRDVVGFDDPDLRAELYSICDSTPEYDPSWYDSEYYTLYSRTFEITSVVSQREHDVWDIEVEAREHSYWTGGMLVSNCSEDEDENV